MRYIQRLLYIWLFALDANLRLNLSFHHVSIQYMNLQSCLMGYFVVGSARDLLCGKIQGSKYKDTGGQFKYCGTHSQFINYFPHRRVKVLVSFLVPVNYEILMSYAVMDAGIAESEPLQKYEYPHLKWVFLNFQIKATRFMYHLVVLKFQRLELFISQDAHVQAWDGPSLLSEQLKPKPFKNDMSKYISATFQCTVSVLLKWSRKAESVVMGHRVLKLDNHISVVINNTLGMSITFPNPTHHQYLFILQLNAETKATFNVTTKKIAYTGTRNILCQFAGVTSYDMISDPPTELATACYSEVSYRHRNIYSKSSTVVLVFYLYPEYGSAHISSSVYTTKCQVIEINTCLFYGQQPKTAKFLNLCTKLKTLPSLKSSCACVYCSAYRHQMFAELSVSEGQCLVAQFNHNTDHYTKIMQPPVMNSGLCFLHNFKHGHINKRYQVLRYTVTGFLKGKPKFCAFPFGEQRHKSHV